MHWEVRTRRAVPFHTLESEQQTLVASIQKDPASRYLLVSEPEATYTCGRSANPEGLLLPASELEAQRIQVQRVSRGGQWTYHGPGQILLYPLTSLESLGYRKRAVCRFLCDFRKSLSRFLDEMSVSHELGDKPFGIYIDGRKLASFGVAIQRGVVSHGAAFYVSDQSNRFRGIHPCGVPGQTLASLQEFVPEITWEETAQRLTDHVKKGFKT